jgi:diamine N-acetyltransferase
MNSYSFRAISKEELMIIKPLWDKLNNAHYRDSIFFKDHYASFTFEKRISKFTDSDDNTMMIEVVESAGPGPVGYCISTISRDGSGEIDSIFIDDNHRGRGIGDTLILNSIAWLQKHGCARIRVAVAHGHESVLSFYQKYGFFPRMTCLEMK